MINFCNCREGTKNSSFWTNPHIFIFDELHTICRFDELLLWWDATSMRCCLDDLPLWWDALRWLASLMTCCFDDLPLWWLAASMTCRFDDFPLWWNGTSPLKLAGILAKESLICLKISKLSCWNLKVGAYCLSIFGIMSMGEVKRNEISQQKNKTRNDGNGKQTKKPKNSFLWHKR